MVSTESMNDGEKVETSNEVEELITELLTEGRYVVRSTTLNSSLKVNGQEFNLNEAEKQVSTYVQMPDGRVEQMVGMDREESKEELRMLNAMSFFPPKAPITIGESWEINLPKVAAEGPFPIASKGTLEAKEAVDGVRTLRVKIKNIEQEATDKMTLEGSLWLSEKDFSVVKADLTLTNDSANGQAPSNTKIRVNLKNAPAVLQPIARQSR